jgi:hypothetical protein
MEYPTRTSNHFKSLLLTCFFIKLQSTEYNMSNMGFDVDK